MRIGARWRLERSRDQYLHSRKGSAHVENDGGEGMLGIMHELREEVKVNKTHAIVIMLNRFVLYLMDMVVTTICGGGRGE